MTYVIHECYEKLQQYEIVGVFPTFVNLSSILHTKTKYICQEYELENDKNQNDWYDQGMQTMRHWFV